MNIKSKIFKRKSGKSEGKWIVRIEFFDEVLGRPQQRERHAATRTEAVDIRTTLTNEIKSTAGQISTGDKMTFGELADIYEQHFYKPAVIEQGRKIAGMKSYKTVRGHLKMLRGFFGKRVIRFMTPESLTEYRVWRLAHGSQRGKVKGSKPVSLSTINRELSSLRAITGFAYEKNWLVKELSFKRVIDADAEQARDRLLTPSEEIRLLEACQGRREVPYTRKRLGRVEKITAVHEVDNPQLKAIILLAIDSGLRRGEILKLQWQDFDFENYLIKVQSANTKTARGRLAPLSDRAKHELLRFKDLSHDGRPFPFNSFNHSFATAKRLAGIDDLRFHDLRRTAITRWQIQGVALAFAGKMAGHSQLQTTQKHYVTADAEMVSEIAKSMNAFETQKIETEFVN